eukprot:m.34600 g.34600  ORF g.34600 m.34600 type:complete len:498 (+) comp6542_c1_seq1:43-1536(+)
MDKLGGFSLFQQVFKSPKHIVAPMVDQSELGWRMLSRNYGAQLTVTPMINANSFVRDKVYRAKLFQQIPEDRPLIAQFCANDAETLVAATKLLEGQCDAVDLNLGCPQNIARRGHYGAFLQEEWDLISEMVRAVHEKVALPITCKIRIFDNRERTLKYAQMLQDSGCQMLTVHGRTRVMKGPKTGLADWSLVKEIKDHLNIPVVSNGNLVYHSDISHCLEQTGCDAVMAAETQLYNPGIFNNTYPIVWEVCREMLRFAKEYNSSFTAQKAHMFRLCHKFIHEYSELRDLLSSSHTHEDLLVVCDNMEHVLKKQREIEYSQGLWTAETDVLEGELYDIASSTPTFFDRHNVNIPIWRCQPKPRNHTRDKEVVVLNELPDGEDVEGLALNRGKSARKKALKRAKLMSKPQHEKKKHENCPSCTTHPRSNKCAHQMCRNCCKVHCIDNILDCEGHSFRIKTHHESRMRRAQAEGAADGGGNTNKNTSTNANRSEHNTEEK